MPMTQFATTLSDYIRAGYPAIAVTTHEEERLLRDLQTLKDVGWSFASWSAVRGWRDPEGKAIKKDSDMYKALDVLAKDVGIVGIFSDWAATVTFYANCMGL